MLNTEIGRVDEPALTLMSPGHSTGHLAVEHYFEYGVLQISLESRKGCDMAHRRSGWKEGG